MRRGYTVFCLGLAVVGAGAQSSKDRHPGPAKLDETPYVLWDRDVAQHWPKTLPAINQPAELTTLSPGQCLRVGAVAQGEGADRFFDGATVGYTLRFAGKEFPAPAESAAAVKMIKPNGMDMVVAALKAADVKQELPIYTAMAATKARWCMPADAGAGPVEIEASVTRGGKLVGLKKVSIPVITPEVPPQFELKDDAAIGAWLQGYHLHPEPAKLGVAIDSIMRAGKMSTIVDEGFVAALKQDPACALRMGPWLERQDTSTQIAAMIFFKQAGLALREPLKLNDEAKASLAQFPALDDPFEFSPDQTQFEKLDRLWSRFTMTGDREPVDALVAMLAWHKDYGAYLKLKQAHERGEKTDSTLTPELVRGVAYTAVGWSLYSFWRSDGLAADYIAAIKADPATPQDIKDELAKLADNPAFQQKK